MQLMHHDLSKHAALMATIVAPSCHQQPQPVLWHLHAINSLNQTAAFYYVLVSFAISMSSCASNISLFVSKSVCSVSSLTQAIILRYL